MDLIKLYESAIYYIVTINYNLKINDYNPILDKFISSYNASSWTIITAYNPQSIVYNIEINKKSNELLLKDIENFTYFITESTDKKQEWETEIGYLILDISLNEAIKIGKNYNQRAIVFGNINKKAKIVDIAL